MGDRQRALLLFSLLAPAMAGLGSQASAEEQKGGISLEFLSEAMVPAGLRFENTCTGGLSAIEYDAARDRYFALSDSSNSARFYTLSIGIAADAAGRPFLAEVAFESMVRLHTREGQPYGDGRVDPEGFVLIRDGTAWISSEGMADREVPPFVDLIDVESGGFLQSAPIPVAYRPRQADGRQVRGTRKNLGFESLALSPDRRQLVTATESALAQDAMDADRGTLFARVLRFRLEPEPRLVEELLYPLEQPAGDIVVHGLVELQALDDEGHMLAMERTYGHDVGLIVKLFEVRLGEWMEDVDRSSLSPAARSLPVLSKRLLLDFEELPIVLDNFEGLTFGPPLPGGGESLLVLGDNDNTECAPSLDVSRLRPTKVLLFRLSR